MKLDAGTVLACAYQVTSPTSAFASGPNTWYFTSPTPVNEMHPESESRTAANSRATSLTTISSGCLTAADLLQLRGTLPLYVGHRGRGVVSCICMLGGASFRAPIHRCAEGEGSPRIRRPRWPV